LRKGEPSYKGKSRTIHGKGRGQGDRNVECWGAMKHEGDESGLGEMPEGSAERKKKLRWVRSTTTREKSKVRDTIGVR